MFRDWRWAAGFVAAAALAWAFTRRADPPTPPVPPAPAATAAPAAAPKPKPAPRPKPAPVAPPETRGAGLRDPGEALGGTPPERGEKPGSK